MVTLGLDCPVVECKESSVLQVKVSPEGERLGGLPEGTLRSKNFLLIFFIGY